ncbi:MAG TPA: CHAD domain-containing protein [Bauldia sp.]|nr:CHAD domain-containing protein [Bauldia sp.]
MVHRVGKHEDAAKALVRLARRDLEAAVREFRDAASREESVHRVRQRLKRVRTILKVLEPAFGDRAVLLRRNLGETARLLATTRDADVVAASARSLAATAGDAQHLGLDRVVSALDAEAAAAHRERTPVGEVNRRLAAAAATVSGFDTSFDGDELIEEAMRRAYARGRKAMKRARQTLATPDLHEWRKSVKHLWFVLRLARKRLPNPASRVAPELERLGEVLGADNDQALLAEKLALSPTGDLSLMGQLSLIAKRRNALETEAFALGGQIYHRKPAAFVTRMAVRKA